MDAAVDPGLDPGYGYHWWLGPDYFWARGAGGQSVFVVPDHDLIVVTTGYSIGDDGWPADILADIVALIDDEPLPANPAGVMALEASIAAAAAPPEPEPVPPLPDTARQVDGRTIVLDDNDLGLRSGVLTFPNDTEAALSLTYIEGTAVDWLIGLDGIDRFFPLRHGLLASAHGGWDTDTTFTIHLDEIGNRTTQQITLTFDGPHVTLDAATFNEFTDTITLTGNIET